MMPSTDQIIDRWFTERIRGSAIAQHTPSWNVLTEAVEDLKGRLAKPSDAPTPLPAQPTQE